MSDTSVRANPFAPSLSRSPSDVLSMQSQRWSNWCQTSLLDRLAAPVQHESFQSRRNSQTGQQSWKALVRIPLESRRKRRDFDKTGRHWKDARKTEELAHWSCPRKVDEFGEPSGKEPTKEIAFPVEVATYWTVDSLIIGRTLSECRRDELRCSRLQMLTSVYKKLHKSYSCWIWTFRQLDIRTTQKQIIIIINIIILR